MLTPTIRRMTPYDVHRSTAMAMLASPPIPKGARYVDAVWPIPVATTVKAASAKDMARAFQSLLEFNPTTMDEVAGLCHIYRRIGSEVEVAFNWAMVIAEGVTPATHWALAFSDGMRAINSVLEFQLDPGDIVAASKPLYGCTDNYFSGLAKKRGYNVHILDLSNPEEAIRAMNPKTKVLYFETVTNPDLRVYDLETISRLAKEKKPNIVIIVDNTFQTPAGDNPLLHGADMVVHSCTKALGGFTQEMAGVAIVPKAQWPSLFLFRKDTGGVPAPEQVHTLLTRGLPTLYHRFSGMTGNAQTIAAALAGNPDISRVNYPGLASSSYFSIAQRLLTSWDNTFAPGFMVAFTPAGKTEAIRAARAERIINYVARYGGGVIKHAVSLGGISSLIEMPFLGTHATVAPAEKELWGIDGGMIRLSVGLAQAEDQLCLLEHAIKHASRRRS
ncbi:MAG: PLP-dependent aspartate aminotransferase family protein [Candidatus Margulisbacteria bacterium]|nr:PLP-dependent aspartate aminotransferase family protein [Candidatus Margulisiibacteriota bacterium]